MKSMKAPRRKTAMKVMKAMRPKTALKSFARMDPKNRELCYSLRHPPRGTKKVPFIDIPDYVTKTDGTKPSVRAVKDAIYLHNKSRKKVGRKEGWQKTSPSENRTILTKFKAIRPDGCGVDSRDLHTSLPKRLAMKVCRRTLIRRLADEGYYAETKIQKSDPGPALAGRRLNFGTEHSGKSEGDWERELQGCGDLKEFTFYPHHLRPKFKRVRASWTYMSKQEKYKPAFVRPKRWFSKSQYKATQKQKVFAMTTSNGKTVVLGAEALYDRSLGIPGPQACGAFSQVCIPWTAYLPTSP